jgi:AP2 domain
MTSKDKHAVVKCQVCGFTDIRKGRLRCRPCKTREGKPPADDAVYLIDGMTARRIPLSKGQYALVDASDFENLSRFTWCARYDKKKGGYYAERTGKDSTGKTIHIHMHREILGVDASLTVDHESGDGLDNRRSKLRPATVVENSRNRKVRKDNTSGLKGVSLNKKTGKWIAQIMADGIQHRLGKFDDPKSAHKAYCEASRRLHGEFGRVA